MYSKLLLISEAVNQQSEGGMFDFDSTLPLVAFQFLLLMAVLNVIYYQPVSKILDSRDEYIRNSLTTASAYLIKANELTEQYEKELASSRKQAQETIRLSQREAQEIVSEQIKMAQQETQQLIENASIQLGKQKERALKTLESQVGNLSDKIQNKLLIGI